MSGWSTSEEEEDRFKLEPTDFKVTNIVDIPPETGEGIQQGDSFVPIPEKCVNHFYEKLGFNVGGYFEGEKKIYKLKK